MSFAWRLFKLRWRLVRLSKPIFQTHSTSSASRQVDSVSLSGATIPRAVAMVELAKEKLEAEAEGALRENEVVTTAIESDLTERIWQLEEKIRQLPERIEQDSKVHTRS